MKKNIKNDVINIKEIIDEGRIGTFEKLLRDKSVDYDELLNQIRPELDGQTAFTYLAKKIFDLHFQDNIDKKPLRNLQRIYFLMVSHPALNFILQDEHGVSPLMLFYDIDLRNAYDTIAEEYKETRKKQLEEEPPKEKDSENQQPVVIPQAPEYGQIIHKIKPHDYYDATIGAYGLADDVTIDVLNSQEKIETTHPAAVLSQFIAEGDDYNEDIDEILGEFKNRYTFTEAGDTPDQSFEPEKKYPKEDEYLLTILLNFISRSNNLKINTSFKNSLNWSWNGNISHITALLYAFEYMTTTSHKSLGREVPDDLFKESVSIGSLDMENELIACRLSTTIGKEKPTLYIRPDAIGANGCSVNKIVSIKLKHKLKLGDYKTTWQLLKITPLEKVDGLKITTEQATGLLKAAKKETENYPQLASKLNTIVESAKKQADNIFAQLLKDEKRKKNDGKKKKKKKRKKKKKGQQQQKVVTKKKQRSTPNTPPRPTGQSLNPPPALTAMKTATIGHNRLEELERKEKALLEMQRKMKKLEMQLEKVKVKNSNQRDENTQLLEQNKLLKKENSHEKNRGTQLGRENKKLKNHNTKQQEMLAQNEQGIAILRGQNKDLLQKVTTAENSLTSLTSKLLPLMKEFDYYRNTYNHMKKQKTGLVRERNGALRRYAILQKQYERRTLELKDSQLALKNLQKQSSQQEVRVQIQQVPIYIPVVPQYNGYNAYQGQYGYYPPMQQPMMAMQHAQQPVMGNAPTENMQTQEEEEKILKEREEKRERRREDAAEMKREFESLLGRRFFKKSKKNGEQTNMETPEKDTTDTVENTNQ